LTTAGCALWAAAFVLAGVLAASAWAAVSSIAGRLALGVGLVVLAVSVLRARPS
jgi:membrane protein DedA with SNARE-associated domain